MKVNRIISFAPWFLIFILVLFWGFFRFYNLDGKVFSPDEVRIVSIAQKKYFEIFRYHKSNIDPPLERLVLHNVFNIFGKSENTSRGVNAFFGTISIIFTYILCYLLFKSHKSSLLVSLLLSTNFFFFRYSQEARYYAFYSAMFLISTITFFKMLDFKRFAFWPYLLFSLCVIISLYLHVFSFVSLFILVVLYLFQVFIFRRSDKKSSLKLPLTMFSASVIVALLLYLPWFIYNSNIKLALISFIFPQNQSIFGGQDWMAKPFPDWSIFSVLNLKFVYGSLNRMFISRISLLIFIFISLFSLAIAIKTKEKKVILLFTMLILNWIMILIASYKLVPGILVDYPSFERRLLYLLPIMAVILTYPAYFFKTQKKYLWFSFFLILLLVLITDQSRLSWHFVTNDSYNQLSAKIPGIFVSKSRFNGVKSLVSEIDGNKESAIVILDDFSEASLVALYYLKESEGMDSDFLDIYQPDKLQENLKESIEKDCYQKIYYIVYWSKDSLSEYCDKQSLWNCEYFDGYWLISRTYFAQKEIYQDLIFFLKLRGEFYPYDKLMIEEYEKIIESL